MEIKILGCGPSVGVPSINCKCTICVSFKKKNQRLRSSIFIQDEEANILIDSGPDLRQQALTNSISYVDAIFYTHAHSDHIGGLPDVIAFSPAKGYANSIIPLYGDAKTLEELKNRYAYLFDFQQNRNFLTLNITKYYQEFYIKKVKFLIFPQAHGDIISSGIIINDKIAYCTDVKSMEEKAFQLLKEAKLNLLIIECFSYQEMKSHINFTEMKTWLKEIKPKRAVLTHMSHELDYDELKSKLIEGRLFNIEPAYDGMVINI